MNRKTTTSVFTTFAIAFILIALVACEPAATFTEAQPSDTKAMSTIPRKMQGKYISANDSSTLIITSDVIKRVFDLRVNSENNKLDSTSSITFDRDNTSVDSSVFSFSKDSKGTHVYVHYSDTLFNIADGDVLKKYKGYYFLNNQRNNGTWTVNKVNSNRKGAVISSISKAEDFETLAEIADDEAQAPHTFSISKNEFKQFIKGGGFAKDEVFIKM